MWRRFKAWIYRRVGLAQINGAVHAVTLRADEFERAIAGLTAFSKVMSGTMAMEHATVDRTPRISIVMATRNRRRLLERAIASVCRLDYPDWELLVVDDGSTDGTAEWLDSLDDPRIVVQHTAGVGAAAARNLGLDAVTGEWVTFLDDDNVIGQWWPKAIAESAERHVDTHVFYGGQLRQQEPSAGPSDDAYMLYVEPFDRERLSGGNYIDLGSLAVRRGADQLWFDPSLQRFIDWEMMVRLAAVHEFRPVPVLTGVYYTRHDTRITNRGRSDAWEQMGQRLRDPADEMGRPRPRP